MLDVNWGLAALGGFYLLSTIVIQWTNLYQQPLHQRWEIARGKEGC